ncbi:hypothetical protein LSAT2_011458 [Lamellibrachia satsuma]|nr:hypothetical protein LSAT2_011458 [Lamellibrachia satsuma]
MSSLSGRAIASQKVSIIIFMQRELSSSAPGLRRRRTPRDWLCAAAGLVNLAPGDASQAAVEEALHSSNVGLAHRPAFGIVELHRPTSDRTRPDVRDSESHTLSSMANTAPAITICRRTSDASLGYSSAMARKRRFGFAFEFSLRVIWMYVNWTFTFLNYISLSQMLGESRYLTKALLVVCACAGGAASVYFAGVVQCVSDNIFRRKRRGVDTIKAPLPSTSQRAKLPTKSKSRRRKVTESCRTNTISTSK